MTQPATPDIAIPADVPDLAGKPRPADRVFFAPPPEQIGPLFRAESSLRVGKRPFALLTRVLWVLASLIPGIVFLVLWFVAGNQNRPEYAVAWCLSALVAFVLGPVLALYFTRFRVSCAYVGQLGAIRYTLRGDLQAKPTTEALLFEQAAELRTAQTRHYLNGAYTGTHYTFNWTNPQGRRVLLLKGKHMGQNGDPKSGDPYYFANASEIAWSMYLLNRADAELAQNGSLQFRIDAKKAVIVGPGFIEFHFNGRVDRCDAPDIKSITLNQGQFAIQHRDAKWYSSKGKFSFPYGIMPNARLFLLVLDRFLPPSTWALK